VKLGGERLMQRFDLRHDHQTRAERVFGLDPRDAHEVDMGIAASRGGVRIRTHLLLPHLEAEKFVKLERLRDGDARQDGVVDSDNRFRERCGSVLQTERREDCTG
jgi:hypothetical protein